MKYSCVLLLLAIVACVLISEANCGCGCSSGTTTTAAPSTGGSSCPCSSSSSCGCGCCGGSDPGAEIAKFMAQKHRSPSGRKTIHKGGHKKGSKSKW